MSSEQLENTSNSFLFKMMNGSNHTNLDKPHVAIIPDGKIDSARQGFMFPVDKVPLDVEGRAAFQTGLNESVQTLVNTTRTEKLAAGVQAMIIFPDGSIRAGGYHGTSDLAMEGSDVGKLSHQIGESLVNLALAVPQDCSSAAQFDKRFDEPTVPKNHIG